MTQYAYHLAGLAAGRLAGFLAAFAPFVPARLRALFGLRSLNHKETTRHFQWIFEGRPFCDLACADRRGEVDSRFMHALIVIWFQWVHDWGYPGIILLMAMESSIFPVPSELVIPPAAYWAEQGRYSLWGVVLAGTVGSYLGAAAAHLVARSVGRAPGVPRGTVSFF